LLPLSVAGRGFRQSNRNTFWAFGAEEDPNGYMNRYSFQDSIRDGATLPLRFESRLIELRVDKRAIEEAYRNLTGSLTEADQDNLGRRAARLAVLLKVPQRVRRLVADIVAHFCANVEPNGFEAMVVTFDRESCALFKRELEKAVTPEEEQDTAKAALTELFNEVKNQNTPVIVERLVDKIDSMVRIVRLEGWQQTLAGEREVQKALRASLLKYKLHKDQDLFDRAYGYIKQYD